MYIAGGIVALLVGIYIGLGMPGLGGREDRVLPRGMKRQRPSYFTPLDLLRRQQRGSEQRRNRRR